MGDRANIKMTGSTGTTYLYTHHCGTELPSTLKAALIRGIADGRATDGQYLARIIFAEMTRGDPEGTTGFGISGHCGDGDDRVLTVDPDNRKVIWPNKAEVSFKDFIESDDLNWPYD